MLNVVRTFFYKNDENFWKIHWEEANNMLVAQLIDFFEKKKKTIYRTAAFRDFPFFPMNTERLSNIMWRILRNDDLRFRICRTEIL